MNPGLSRLIFFAFVVGLALVSGTLVAKVVQSSLGQQRWAWTQADAQTVKPSPALVQPVSAPTASAATPEARLIEVYQLISQARTQEALEKAQALALDVPHFQLAQLVLGDLLTLQVSPLEEFGAVPAPLSNGSAAQTLAELRQESLLRLRALRERPPQDALPSQFLALAARNRHAIAIDASRSRLYLFENTAQQPRLVADFYVSVGKSGIEKTVEGDARTPLGVYFIVSNLDRKTLSDYYGSGALPINYPNVLDSKRGKTGRGIWLHGTPPKQYARAPLASDGCVVLANPDLEFISRTVEPRTTPVVISARLDWVPVHSIQAEREPFETTLAAWRLAKSSGDIDSLLRYYTPDFNSYGKSLSAWSVALRNEMDKMRGKSIQLKDLSYLRWSDAQDTMVVTFGEVADGERSGPTKRQYWVRQGQDWKIFFEGVL